MLTNEQIDDFEKIIRSWIPAVLSSNDLRLKAMVDLKRLTSQAKSAAGGAEPVAIVGTQLSVTIIIGSQVTQTDERKTAMFLKDVPVGTELFAHPSVAGMPDKQLARLFHDTYEELAPNFGYVTRQETRQFDPLSPNGRLMIAVCARVRALGGA